MYADKVTDSMKRTMDETARRRKIQQGYNQKNKIQPATIRKEIREGIEKLKKAKLFTREVIGENQEEHEFKSYVAYLYERMERASSALDFERAVKFRDEIRQLESKHGLQKESLLALKNRPKRSKKR